MYCYKIIYRNFLLYQCDDSNHTGYPDEYSRLGLWRMWTEVPFGVRNPGTPHRTVTQWTHTREEQCTYFSLKHLQHIRCSLESTDSQAVSVTILGYPGYLQNNYINAWNSWQEYRALARVSLAGKSIARWQEYRELARVSWPVYRGKGIVASLSWPEHRGKSIIASVSWQEHRRQCIVTWVSWQEHRGKSIVAIVSWPEHRGKSIVVRVS